MPTNPVTTQPRTVPDFHAAKLAKRKLVVVTAYDATAARLVDAAGVDAILVGDSLGMVVQGHPTSLPVTLDEMVYHTRCAARGTRTALLVADLPFMTYQISPEQALASSGRLIQEGGAAAVKLEGGERTASAIAAVVAAGIPVMGHVGMTPQSVHQFGGFKVQRAEERIVADAHAVERAGAFSVVLECVPEAIAARITRELTIPTIGIGAGAECDGQVLVFHDLLGMLSDFRPKFVKAYLDLGTAITGAIAEFAREVRDGSFPDAAHSFH